MKLSSVLHSSLLAAALTICSTVPSVVASSNTLAFNLQNQHERLASLSHRLTDLQKRLQRVDAEIVNEMAVSSDNAENDGDNDEIDNENEDEDENDVKPIKRSSSFSSADVEDLVEVTSASSNGLEGNSLLATWNHYFPLSTTAAGSSGWVKDTNKTCSSGSALGIRYRSPSNSIEAESGIHILYGENGEVAGIQSVVNVKPSEFLTSPKGPYVEEVGVNGHKIWTITAYFREPKTICDPSTHRTGRSADGLWFTPNGHLSSAFSVPRSIAANQNQVNVPEGAGRPFIKGKCMSSMGVHYVRTKWNDKVGEIDPYFLLYHPTTHQLVSFGFLSLFGVTTSPLPGKYWEHIPVAAAPLFMNLNQIPLDLVLGNIDGRKFQQNAIHFYFVSDPKNNILC